MTVTPYIDEPPTGGWNTRPRAPSPATHAEHIAIVAQANRTAHAVIKRVARDYVQRPSALNAIIPGLRFEPPSAMLEILLRLTRAPRQRHFGFGGEVPAINLRSAMLCARFMRAKEIQREKRRRRTG